MKNIKVIAVVFITYVAILLIVWVLNVVDQAQVMDLGKKGLLIAVILAVLGGIFDLVSPKK